MNREQMRETIASLIVSRSQFDDTATAILGAILPQITTAEELAALPEGAGVSFDNLMLLRVSQGRLRSDGWVGTFEQAASELAPLTVVWQPEP